MRAVILDADTLGTHINLEAIDAQVDDLTVYSTTAPEQVTERIAQSDIVITNKVKIERQHFEQASQLKLICILATGTNNIDHEAAAEFGVTINNVEAYGTASVVQHTLMMMLSLAAQMPVMQQRLANGDWQRSELFCLLQPGITELANKHLVIVGSGELGQAVEKQALALGMKVTFSARPGNDTDPRPSFTELLPQADVISFHCPLTKATKGLLNQDSLALCQPHALVINNARGGVVHEQDVLAALKAGTIGGFATDVLPQEPPRDGHPLLDALNEPLNLIVTPHNAWTSPEARQRIVELTANNIRSFINA